MGPAARPTALADAPVDQRIRRDIAEAIFDQRMPPGTHLSESRLGALYGVSRTVVRKALFQLAGDKLIDIRPNRGAKVREPTIDDARAIFAARRLIESGLLEHSVPVMTPADHAHLRGFVDADLAAHDSGDRQRMIRASGAFHRELAHRAGNAPLAGFLDELIGQTSLIIALYEHRQRGTCARDAHALLIEDIERRDVAAARDHMIRHLCDCESRLALTTPPTTTDLTQMLTPVDSPAD